ncbi:MAG: C2 family cysteine protease [Deltaproteobacteria bacterium]|nr:C2 family cysteine protease [Deltaproteobacteria bacterium]
MESTQRTTQAQRTLIKPLPPVGPLAGPVLSPTVNLDDPPLREEDRALLASGDIQYKRLPGVLIRDNISADDINQGSIGDCYFLAALSSVANSNPAFIRESIRMNADGTYTVRFFRQGKPIYVRVDGDIPQTRWGTPIYGTSTDSGELWVSIMEKAYAKLQLGYHQINKGGYPEEALRVLTGIGTKVKFILDDHPDKIYSILKKSLGKGRSVVASTYGANKKFERNGVIGHHAYTVLRVYEKNGMKYVELRNPWGHKEWNGSADGANDGTFSMPIAEFQKYFSKISATEKYPREARPLGRLRMLAV